MVLPRQNHAQRMVNSECLSNGTLIPVEDHITYEELMGIAPETHFKTQRCGYVSMHDEVEHLQVYLELISRWQNIYHEHDQTMITDPIPLLPPEQQINAIYRLPDANFLNEMISLSHRGLHHPRMVDTIKANGAYTQAYLGSLPRQLNRGYDFFGLDGELVYANEVSQAYAEGNPEPMMLAAFELLCWRRPWNGSIDILSPPHRYDAINTHYPNWNNDKQPADRVWLKSLDWPVANEKMIGKVVSITDKGRQVLARWILDRTLIGDATEIDIDNSLPSVPYVDILKELEDQTELILNHKQLKGIHNGLHANPEKRFIILSGLSGLGRPKCCKSMPRSIADC